MSFEPHYITTFIIYLNLFLVIIMCINYVFNKYKPKPPKKVKKVKKKRRRIMRVD